MKIYFASKMKHANVFKEFALKNPQHHMVSRWPYIENEIPATKEHAVNFWRDDLRDVAFADLCVVYGEQGDILKGALVEAGFALAVGVHVLVVGNVSGTWVYSEGVTLGKTVGVTNLESLSRYLG